MTFDEANVVEFGLRCSCTGRRKGFGPSIAVSLLRNHDQPQACLLRYVQHTCGGRSLPVGDGVAAGPGFGLHAIFGFTFQKIAGSERAASLVLVRCPDPDSSQPCKVFCLVLHSTSQAPWRMPSSPAKCAGDCHFSPECCAGPINLDRELHQVHAK